MNNVEKELTKLLKEWQKRLRLQDWNVTVQVVPFFDVFAQIETAPEHKEAVMRICSPDSMNPNWIGESDLQVCLVHELTHLHFRGFDHLIKPDTAEYMAMEQSVEIIAQALVNAKNGVVSSQPAHSIYKVERTDIRVARELSKPKTQPYRGRKAA